MACAVLRGAWLVGWEGRLLLAITYVRLFC